MTEERALRLKDISDWLKIVAVVVTMALGYARISEQVAQHTSQLSDVRSELSKMREENRTRDMDMQYKIGSIQLYLCSKDTSHCDPNTLAPTNSRP